MSPNSLGSGARLRRLGSGARLRRLGLSAGLALVSTLREPSVFFKDKRAIGDGLREKKGKEKKRKKKRKEKKRKEKKRKGSKEYPSWVWRSRLFCVLLNSLWRLLMILCKDLIVLCSFFVLFLFWYCLGNTRLLRRISGGVEFRSFAQRAGVWCGCVQF